MLLSVLDRCTVNTKVCLMVLLLLLVVVKQKIALHPRRFLGVGGGHSGDDVVCGGVSISVVIADVGFKMMLLLLLVAFLLLVVVVVLALVLVEVTAAAAGPTISQESSLKRNLREHTKMPDINLLQLFFPFLLLQTRIIYYFFLSVFCCCRLVLLRRR